MQTTNIIEFKDADTISKIEQSNNLYDLFHEEETATVGVSSELAPGASGSNNPNGDDHHDDPWKNFNPSQYNNMSFIPYNSTIQ